MKETIRLKFMLLECELGQKEFAPLTGWGATNISQALKGIMPKKIDQFKAGVENAVKNHPCLKAWLETNGLDTSAIWEPVPDLVSRRPTDWMRRRMSATRRFFINMPALKAGDPLAIETHKEGQMIDARALKHFKLFRNPFVNDISDLRDIFFSEDHLFIKEMMLDSARYAGFTAVFGEVGSGKSVIRKAVVQNLIGEDIQVIYPIIVDKSRITPGSLIDAIIMDISEESPKRSLEAKTRQALRLLRNRANSGMKQVLVIEEAHLLSVSAMKALKQIYELEDGYSRLIGIILIGQPELKFLLDETRHPELREVSRRVTCAEIAGLDGELPRYLRHKFGRIKKETNEIFIDDAFKAMRRRLQVKNGRGNVVSKAFPLTINNLAARAMNLAAEMGEEKVTADVVNSL